MCTIDWEDERFQPMDGNRVYADIEDLKKDHECWNECGIVEVEVSFVREVVPQQDLSLPIKAENENAP
jgi:hypothetical protein